MKKTFISNIILLLVLNALIKPFYLFGIDRKFQLALGTETYGLYYNLFSFALILQVINDFGLQNYISKYASQNREKIHEKFRDLLGFKLFLSALYIIISLILAFVYYRDSESITYIVHLCFNQILVSLIFFFRSNIVGLGKYKTDSILSVLDRIILICLGLMVLYIPAFSKYLDIGFFISIQTLSLLICVCIAASICYGSGFVILPRFDLSLHLKEMAKESLPFFLIGLFHLMLFRQDNIILKKLLEDSDLQIGIYASSMRLYEAATLVSLTFSSFLLAMFSRLHHDREMITKLFEWSNTGLMILTLIIVVTVVPNAAVINRLLYAQSDDYWNQILIWSFLAFIAGSMNYILGAFFQAVHLERILWKVYFFGFVVNAVFNIIFIPEIKSLSCAYGLFITQLFIFIFQIFILYRSEIINWNAALLTKFALLALCAFAWGIVSKGKFWTENILLVFIINGIIICIVSFLLGIIKWKSLYGMWKKMPKALQGSGK